VSTVPAEVGGLVERFARNREAYRSAAYNETQARREFIDPLFKALGWDVDNESGLAEAYKDVIHEDAIKVGGATKAPDYCFRIGGTRKFFVEAKKPAVGVESDPEPAYQLRRYAWTSKLPLSILTDFEEFAVYDCRIPPKVGDKASAARVFYATCDQYAEHWDYIAGLFSKDAVLKGAFDKYAESNKRKKGTAEVDTEFLRQIEAWRLGLAQNFAVRNPKLAARDLNFAVQRTIDRLIFLRMCEDRGIEIYGGLQSLLNGDKLYECLAVRFRQADDKYNSGLFYFNAEAGREPPDTLTLDLKVDDKVLRDIIGSLYYPESPYEFSVLPPEILGQVYEQFLGKVIRLTAGHHAKVEEKPEVRKAGGVYYTPAYIVDYIVKNTVGKLLEGKTPASVGPDMPRRGRGAKGAARGSTRVSSPPLPHGRGSDQAPPTRADFEYFFPTSTLVTARGIITLWVARMVITALYFTKRVPFQHVHIHPIIQDGQGRTMSKSLGNGVDPVDIIALYGTDALRFTMAQMDTETQDVRMPVKPVKLPDGRTVNSSEKFELGRNFCNKIWQAATGFVFPNIEARRHEGTEARRETWPRPLRREDLAIEDRWILSRLAGCIAEVDRRLERYQISEVANALYSFFWSDFCDWYVELVKPRLYVAQPPPAGCEAENSRGRLSHSADVARQVLVWVLDQSLRLLHPIIPFLTEALWQQLNEKVPQRGLAEIKPAEPALIVAPWPAGGVAQPPSAGAWRDLEVEREMTALQDVIRALRDTLARINTNRSAAKQPAIGKTPHALLRADESIAARLAEQHAVIERLGRCESLEIGTTLAKPPESATQVLAGVEVYVPLHGLMNLDVERKRLTKERDELQGHIARLSGKLANEGFVAKAPAAVVEQERTRLAEMNDRLATIERNLADVG
jgi:hypothetical protein